MIGVNKAIIVVAAGPFQFAMVNPVITKKSGEYQTEESCLSLDGARNCTRYREIEVDYLDQNFKPQHGKYSGWTAQSSSMKLIIATELLFNQERKKMNEEKNETRWDRLLAVRTTGRDDTNADQYRYPYEPTPYSVLERLANSGLIRKENTLLDYGCGKGRVDFFMSYQTRCQSIGVEYNERIYEKAMNNKESTVASGRVLFALANAERYTVPETVTDLFF